MTSTTLKLIAVITMLIDHVGLAIFPQYVGMRIIGRLAFPLYCFLLTEGAVYTKNWLKYAGRLLLFALLAEVPFDLVLARTPVYFGYQNVFWTLAAGLVIVRLWYLYGCIRGKMYAMEKLTLSKGEVNLLVYLEKNPKSYKVCEILLPAICILLVLCCRYGRTDYGGFGAILIWLLFIAKDLDITQKKRMQLPPVSRWSHLPFWLFSAGVIVVMCLMYGGLEKWGILAAIPVLLYNGKRGWCPKVLQYGFYLFYPLHLLAIAAYVMLF